MVAILLKQGANVNAQGEDFGNVLQAALSGGHKKEVAIFFEQGVDVDAQGGEYGNAPQVALAEGYEEVKEMLLERVVELAHTTVDCIP
ncbi:hypothetical protein LTR49_028133 [Elasticomyces elasticus]|nr:hypothetical protein LTR49_028133 [Elasticomyces elasticus]KAK5733135.1 hypothetical protein LTS12_026995 [Elasticomyces elasticus]